MDLLDFGIDVELNEELEIKAVNHRERFAKMMMNRYLEILPTLIHVKNEGSVSIDFMMVEVALMNNVDVVIGMNTNDRLTVLGYANSKQTKSNPSNFFEVSNLKRADITFIVPENEIPKDLKEIDYRDGCQTGNFVVVRNKILNYQSDHEVIRHYVMELAEIVLSRFSLSMQAKITTFFLSQVGDETINQIITKLYNGSPYIKVGNAFDPIEQIINVSGASNVATNMVAMKDEYQNKISELNNMLGINSLAVDKASGVSDSEAKSNRAFTASNANIKLVARNHAYKKLNMRYGLELEAVYNDGVESEESDKLENDSDNNGIDSQRIAERGFE